MFSAAFCASSPEALKEAARNCSSSVGMGDGNLFCVSAATMNMSAKLVGYLSPATCAPVEVEGSPESAPNSAIASA